MTISKKQLKAIKNIKINLINQTEKERTRQILAEANAVLRKNPFTMFRLMPGEKRRQKK